MKDDDSKKSKILSFSDAAQRNGKTIKGQIPVQENRPVSPLDEVVDIRARQNLHRIVDYLDEMDERMDRHADAIRALLVALKELKGKA
jgi:hypothetical protein